MNRKITLILPLMILGFIFNAKAQSCPPNIDWETGTYSVWQYYTGTCCPLSLPTAGWVAGRHLLTTGPGTDPYGGFPIVAPGGGAYSFKLGNDGTGSQAERARYYVHIPTGGIYSLIYRYAVVLNDPSHTATEQPRMEVNAVDSNTGLDVNCAHYLYIASGSVPGFLASGSTAGGGAIYYKTWTMGNMKFPGLGGHTAIVDFTTGDCGYGGHFGYGYIDMTCGLFANQILGCAFGTTVLAAPDGYASYSWRDSATYASVYGTSQIVVITAPTVTTTYAVILTPYTGYGCPDTLFTRVIPSTLSISMGADTSICSGASVTLRTNAASASMPISYFWTPSTGLSCTTCSNPIATPSVTTTYSVTVSDAAGCLRFGATTITVYPTPGSITGPGTVCPGDVVTLGTTASSAIWTCGPTSIATINPTTGALTGVATGTVTVIASTGGICTATRIETVNPLPAAIGGLSHVCVGQNITLTDATSGGTWSAPGYSAIATIGSASGIVTGIFAGTASITYTVGSTGCRAFKSVTVDASPSAISGTLNVCQGLTTPLTSFPAGGTWSTTSSNASIGSTTGVVLGITSGTASVTYTLSTGCYVTAVVTVDPIPLPIAGPTHVCEGGTSTITLTDATLGGHWDATNGNATVGYGTGIVTGITAGIDTILYYNTAGCPAQYIITVDPTPSPIIFSPTATVCVGATRLASCVDPGTWSITPSSIASISSTSGVITGIAAGSATVTITSPYGCIRTAPFTVLAPPLPIAGSLSVCVGLTTTLSDATIPGTFSGSGAFVSITPGGAATGLGLGTQTITYTHTPTGCQTFAVVTVNATPGPVIGALSVCQGTTGICYANSVTGGTWSITPTTVATIGSLSGCITTVTTSTSSLTATITYSLGAGCTSTGILTVNPLPAPITPISVCVGSNGTLTGTPGGGTWSTTSPNATVNSTTGSVVGVSAGTATITYTLPSASACYRTVVVTVNAIPLPITGPGTVCVGNTIDLDCASGGGVWSSLSMSIGTVVPATGIVTGIAPGSTVIKYTLTATGCARTATVTVNAQPALFTVTGGGSYCAGGSGVTVGLTGSTGGVSYALKLSGSTVATLIGTGSTLNFGAQTAAGVYTVDATAGGCTRTMTGSALISINPIPTITGPSAVCVGANSTLVGTPGPGTWVSSLPTVASIVPSTGFVTGITSGSSTVITYSVTATGCSKTFTVNVTLSPGPIIIPSGVCVASCVTLGNIVSGGMWSSSSSCVSIGSLSGIVCGVSAPCAAPVTYSLGSGCTVTGTINVTPQPAPIGGGSAVCVGGNTTVNDATPGGVWAVDPASVGLISIVPSGTSCTVTGLSAGLATLSYISSGGTGCGIAKIITVNPLPSIITGPMQVCQGSSVALSDTVTGGIWSVAPISVASIVSSTGVLTGAVTTATIPAYATVTYSAIGCNRTAIVTVNPLPSSLAGTNHVCAGAAITLTSSPVGGTWSTSNPGLGTVSSAGVVTGGPGYNPTTPVLITYTLPTGCYKSMNVTVNQSPAPVVGPAGVCVGLTATFTDPMSGGVWSSSNTSVAPIVATSGMASGSSPGTTVITYTWAGCTATTTFTVIPTPLAMVGPATICINGSATYTDPTAGGTWSSTLPAIGTIDPATGFFSAITSGTTILHYGVGSGCEAPPKAVVVNPMAPIVGVPIVCEGQNITLVDTAYGGSWSSLTTGIATVNPITGSVHGVAAGLATIHYTLASGCYASVIVTVNAAPAPITGMPFACVGQTVTMATASTGGTWTSSNGAVASIDIAGNVTAVAPGTTVIGYTYTSTGCSSSKTFTVNAAGGTINGPSSVCLTSGATITLTCAGAGIWSSSDTTVATVSSTGVVTAHAIGTVTISYGFSSGCISTKVVSVIGSVAPITGTDSVCQASTTNLSDTSGGGSGTWTSAAPSIASVGTASGIVTGMLAGTTTITYTLGPSCYNTMLVKVNPLPGAITGNTNICESSVSTLHNSIGGGTWTSSMPGIASIDPVSGLLSGIAAGTCIVYYTLPTGCAVSATINVNPGPTPISGPNSLCVGGSAAYFNPTGGGIWHSSNTAVGDIDTISGMLSGMAAGSIMVSYTVIGFSCPAIMPVTVNTVPGAISGPTDICQGQTGIMTNPVSSGTWSSSHPVAIIDPVTGNLTAVVIGSPLVIPVTITYSLGAGAGCSVTKNINVNPLPAAISGSNTVCTGMSITLSDPTLGGSWSSTATGIGSIGSTTGILTGVAAGITTVSYTNTYTCASTHMVTVFQSPAAITGSANICLGGTSTLYNTVGGGTWTSANTAIATIHPVTGVVTGIALGTTTIMYKMPGNCTQSKVITVYPLPLSFAIMGGGNRCPADSGVHITLSSSSVGVNYMLYRGATAVGTFPGTGGPLDFGLQTVSGTYTAKGTSTLTGCSISMSGTVSVVTLTPVTPSVTINVSPNDTVCAGSTVSFTPNPTNGGFAPLYNWSVNGSPVSMSTGYSFIPADGDVVTVTLTSNATCATPPTATRSMTMSVKPFGAPHVDVTLSPNDTVCAGTLVTANAVTAFGGSAPAMTWYKNGSIVAYSGSSYSFAASNGDEIFCVLFSNDPCRLGNYDSSARMVEVAESPILPIVTINAKPGTIISKGQDDTLTAVVTKAVNPTYQWYVNGLPIMGATAATFINTLHTYPEQDSISCAVTSHAVCEVTAHQWVYIKVTTEGISQLGTGSDITVVPNPNKGTFTIKGNLATTLDEDVTLEVTNVIGQVVHKDNVLAKGGKISHQVTLGKNLANGMYMLTLRSGSDSKVFHIVVEQ